MSSNLIAPYGGTLVDLMVDEERAQALRAESLDWPSWSLSQRQLCDLELLLCGAYSPLRGFLGRADYESVCRRMTLSDGTLWPLPIVLDLPEAVAEPLSPGDKLALRDPEGVMLAALTVQEQWRPDRGAEATQVYGTDDPAHPGVAHLLSQTNPVYLSGTLEGVQLPVHYDFRMLRRTPAEARDRFQRRGWRRVIGFQTRNPLHRMHVTLTFRAARELQANLFIHPVVGLTKPGDLDHYTRVRCYQAVMPRYPKYTAELGLLPMSMRMAGPREALIHGIVRRNYGCTHFIVGRDQGGPGLKEDGTPFYPPYAAQELFGRHQQELGIEMVPVGEMVYVEEQDEFVFADEAPAGAKTARFDGTELRRLQTAGRPIHERFSYPEVIRELRRTYPPRHRQGFTVFFTGLSGAGKSTIANVLFVRLLELGGRPVTLLDGDIVRRNLSSELTFSKEHRDINIRRIGYVASEISKNRGIAICAPIAPYDGVRREVRQMVGAVGGFVLVHVATPLSVCEQRDRKGMYAKARAGIIKEFTGISDPYEEPADAEVIIDTTGANPEECAQQVLLYLQAEGYISLKGEDNGD